MPNVRDTKLPSRNATVQIYIQGNDDLFAKDTCTCAQTRAENTDFGPAPSHRYGWSGFNLTTFEVQLRPEIQIKFNLLKWVIDYPHPNYPYPNTWTSSDVAMFSAAAGKDLAVTGVLLQKKVKLLYEGLFPNATMPFSSSKGLGSLFTTSELHVHVAERNRERCNTVYYSVAI